MPSPKPPYLLSPAQVRRLSPHFSLPHGIPRVDDRRVLSGINGPIARSHTSG
jgi:hypothetical protein